MSVLLSAVLWYILTRTPSTFDDVVLDASSDCICSARQAVVQTLAAMPASNEAATTTTSSPGQDIVVHERRRDRIMKAMTAVWRILETRGLAQNSLAPFIGKVFADHSNEDIEGAAAEVAEMREYMDRLTSMQVGGDRSLIKAKL